MNSGAPKMMRPETKYTKLDAGIAYQVVGEGPIDLVMVPGFVSHVEYIWEEPRGRQCPQTPRIVSSRVIMFDKRGTGLSDRVGPMPILEQRMDDVRAVMDAVGVGRRRCLGGRKAALCPSCSRRPSTWPGNFGFVDLDGFDALAAGLHHPFDGFRRHRWTATGRGEPAGRPCGYRRFAGQASLGMRSSGSGGPGPTVRGEPQRRDSRPADGSGNRCAARPARDHRADADPASHGRPTGARGTGALPSRADPWFEVGGVAWRRPLVLCRGRRDHRRDPGVPAAM